MSEPRLVQRHEGSTPMPTQRPPAPGARSLGIRQALRGKSFSEGEAWLSPRGDSTPVQMKPDPKGGPPGKEHEPSESDAQCAGDGELRAEIGELRAGHSELQARTEAIERERAEEKEAKLNKWLKGAGAALGRARPQLFAIESFVEEILVQDQRRDADARGLDRAVDAYQDARAPGLLDALVSLTSVASMFKSIVETARIALSQKAGSLAGSLTDASRASVGTADAAERHAGKAASARHGDGVTSMVAALEVKLVGLQAEIESVRGFALGLGFQLLAIILDQALSDLCRAAEAVDSLGRPPSEAFIASVNAVLSEIYEACTQLEARAGKCHKLVAARTPDDGGGELAEGTVGRSLFDLVHDSPGDFTLLVATELHVDAAFGPIKERSVASGYWLRAADEGRMQALRARQRMPLTLPLLRPSQVAAADLPLSPERGRPLTSVCGQTIELPHETVVVQGRSGRRAVARAEWEDGARRQALLDSLNRFIEPRNTLP
jgi:hypothetical protein